MLTLSFNSKRSLTKRGHRPEGHLLIIEQYFLENIKKFILLMNTIVTKAKIQKNKNVVISTKLSVQSNYHAATRTSGICALLFLIFKWFDMIDISLSIIDLDTPKACVAWLLGAGVKPLQATPPPLHEFSAVKSFFVVVSSRQVYRISIQSTPLVTRDLNLFMSLVFSSFKKPDKSLKKHLAIFLLGGGGGGVN